MDEKKGSANLAGPVKHRKTKKIWDKSGKEHTVDHLNYRDLIDNCGWYGSPPVNPEIEDPELKAKRLRSEAAEALKEVEALEKKLEEQRKKEAERVKAEEVRKAELLANYKESQLEEGRKIAEEEARKAELLKLTEKADKEELKAEIKAEGGEAVIEEPKKPGRPGRPPKAKE